jgi:hypothetical protein
VWRKLNRPTSFHVIRRVEVFNPLWKLSVLDPPAQSLFGDLNRASLRPDRDPVGSQEPMKAHQFLPIKLGKRNTGYFQPFIEPPESHTPIRQMAFAPASAVSSLITLQKITEGRPVAELVTTHD